MRSSIYIFTVSAAIVFNAMSGTWTGSAFATPSDRQPEPATVIVQQAPPPPETLDEASFLNMEIHDLAAQIMRNFRNSNGANGPVAVATFVDVNNLYRTSPFGRYLAEQLMGEMQRAGFSVIELRKTGSILIKEQFGEYAISRDIKEIAKTSPAGFILVGTYSTRDKYIMINARLVSSTTGMIASSGMKILRKDPLVSKMLWPSATPHRVQPVKMPIKELGSGSNVEFIPGS